MSIKGIYHYVDVETDEVVYIGKDSYINHSKRHSDHKMQSNYNKVEAKVKEKGLTWMEL